MNWYYVEAGQQVGPVSDTEFGNLVNIGKIQPSTLVWHEGMANWQPYATAREGASPPGAPGVTGEPQMQSGSATASSAEPQIAGVGQVICAECGKIFPQGSAFQFGQRWVCANCKPFFVQKLKEGAYPAAFGTGLDYAGFWIRLGAKMVDGIILAVVLGIPMAIVLFSMVGTGGGRARSSPFEHMGLQVILQLAFYLFSLAYNVFFLGKYGATPGKMACSLKVVSAEGGAISYARALGRSAAEILSGLICDIGYIIAAFDGEKRALHDHIANTRVIRK